jgi:hypothetical protein
METAPISNAIKSAFVPAYETVNAHIKETLESQKELIKVLERLTAEVAIVSQLEEQSKLDNALIKCGIQQRRIVMLEKRLSTILEQIDRIEK